MRIGPGWGHCRCGREAPGIGRAGTGSWEALRRRNGEEQDRRWRALSVQGAQAVWTAALLVLATRTAPAWSGTCRRPADHGGVGPQIGVGEQVLCGGFGNAPVLQERGRVGEVTGGLCDGLPVCHDLTRPAWLAVGRPGWPGRRTDRTSAHDAAVVVRVSDADGRSSPWVLRWPAVKAGEEVQAERMVAWVVAPRRARTSSSWMSGATAPACWAFASSRPMLSRRGCIESVMFSSSPLWASSSTTVRVAAACSTRLVK